MSDIKNALHIPRESLIERLQVVKGEHEQKRQDAEAKSAKAREGLLEAVSSLEDDQVANILDHFGVRSGSTKTLTEWVEDVVENDKFKTLPADPTGVETSLDRTIRVLTLASDKEIEVSPSDSVYSYL